MGKAIKRWWRLLDLWLWQWTPRELRYMMDEGFCKLACKTRKEKGKEILSLGGKG